MEFVGRDGAQFLLGENGNFRPLLRLVEMLRVVRQRVVILTWDPDASGFWLIQDYFPEIAEVDRRIMPSLEELRQTLGPSNVEPVPVPHDCSDGFLGAYWRRPHAYLDARLRGAISTFTKIGNVDAGLARLRSDLEDGTWAQRNAHLLERSEIPAAFLTVELTEETLVKDFRRTARVLEDLHAIGVRISIDDFGTGYSALSYLKHLPVNYLKIDGAFVKDMLQDPTSRAMVEMIHRIGHVMGKETIAEFAESEAIVEALRGIGVNYAQGYAVARPVPLAECLEPVHAASATA